MAAKRAWSNTDPKITLMRAAKTQAMYRYGMGGLPKTLKKPKPITLPKLKCLEPEPTR